MYKILIDKNIDMRAVGVDEACCHYTVVKVGVSG
jgi:hypothetical protein